MQQAKDIVFKSAGVLILLATFAYSFVPTVAAWVMVFAVAAFTSIVATTPYPGKSIRGKRLHNFQVVACLLLVVATYLMFRQNTFWVVLLLASAILFLYASVVLPKALEQENNPNI